MADDSTPPNQDTPQDPSMSSDETGLIQQLHKNLGDVNPPKAQMVDPHPDEQGDAMLQEKTRIWQEHKQRAEEADATYQRYQGELEDINKQLLAERATNPTPPTPRPFPAQPDPNQQKQTAGNLFGQILSLVAIGSAVFGKHRGPYGSAIAMSGAGAFLKAFSEGQHEQGKEALETWNKSVELTSKLNAEDRQTYNEILANKRLDLSQQHQLMADVADMKGDSVMYDAASRRDLNDVMKVLANKMKAQVAFSKAQIAINKTAIDNWMEKTSQGRTWAAWVESKTHVDPTKKGYEEFVKFANDPKYSPAKWIEEHTKKQTTEEGGDKASEEKTQPTLSPGNKRTSGGERLATDTPLTPDQARSMLKPGDWFEGTNGKFYQIPPQ
jgi:hypothetical protein